MKKAILLRVHLNRWYLTRIKNVQIHDIKKLKETEIKWFCFTLEIVKKMSVLLFLMMVSCSPEQIVPENEKCQGFDITGEWDYIEYKPQNGQWQSAPFQNVTFTDSTMVCYSGQHIHPYTDYCLGNFVIGNEPYNIEVYDDTMHMIKINSMIEYKLKRIIQSPVYNPNLSF